MLGEADRTQTSGTLYEVTDTNEHKYRGRFVTSITTATFEEDSTHFRATVQYPVESFRVAQSAGRICAVLRSKYIERSMKDSCEERRRNAEEQI